MLSPEGPSHCPQGSALTSETCRGSTSISSGIVGFRLGGLGCDIKVQANVVLHSKQQLLRHRGVKEGCTHQQRQKLGMPTPPHALALAERPEWLS